MVTLLLAWLLVETVWLFLSVLARTISSCLLRTSGGVDILGAGGGLFPSTKGLALSSLLAISEWALSALVRAWLLGWTGLLSFS